MTVTVIVSDPRMVENLRGYLEALKGKGVWVTKVVYAIPHEDGYETVLEQVKCETVRQDVFLS